MRTVISTLLLMLILLGCESSNNPVDNEDKQRILYHLFNASNNTAKVYSMKPDGTDKSKLIDMENSCVWAKFSYDKSHIAFILLEEGSKYLYISKADGKSARKIDEVKEVRSISWSNNSLHLVVSEYFVAMNKDVLSTVDIANNYEVNYLSTGTKPVWAPASDKIIYSDYDSEQQSKGIFVINSDGTGKQKLSIEIGKYYDIDFYDWSPDGTTIVYHIYSEYQIHTVNIDGSNKQVLIEEELYQPFSPKWSPDGSKIMYELECALEPPSKSILVVVDKDGKNRKEITSCEGLITSYLWSPDGKQLVYCITDYDNEFDMYVVNSDGSGKKKLSDGIYSYIPSDWK